VIYYLFAIILPLIFILFIFEFKTNKTVFNTLLIVIGLLFYLLYGYVTKDYNLYCFSNTLNPFSIMTGFDELNISEFVYKVIVAYLFYQFIISLRQNTRRK
jgi:hypothetical protein